MTGELTDPERAKPVTALVVDDNLAHARLLTTCLEVAVPGVVVERAGRVSTALRRIDEVAVDIVFVDLFLPDAQGTASLEALRARAPMRPIVVVTALDEASVVSDVMQAGAVDLIVKDSLDEPLVKRTVARALSRPLARGSGDGSGTVLDRPTFIAAAEHQLALAARAGTQSTMATMHAAPGHRTPPPAIAAAALATVRGSDIVGRVTDDHVTMLLLGDETHSAGPLQRIAARLPTMAGVEHRLEADVQLIEPGVETSVASLLPAPSARELHPAARRIVVAVSDRDEAERLSGFLEAEFEIHLARSSVEMLRVASLEQVDAVVVDVGTAGEAGDTVRSLGGQRETAQTPVVLVADDAPPHVASTFAGVAAPDPSIVGTIEEVLRARRRP